MLGRRIAELRKNNNMTQEDLAKKLGVSRSALALWEQERREVPDETKKILITLFNVTADYLLGITNDPRPPIGGGNYTVIAAHRKDLFAEISDEEAEELEQYLEWLRNRKKNK